MDDKDLDKLASLIRDPSTNGARAIDDEARQQARKPRFDGTVNLGHLLTILTMLVAMASMWAKNEVARADHESRIKALESAQVEFKQTLAKLAENEAAAMRNQDRISTALEYLMKKQ